MTWILLFAGLALWAFSPLFAAASTAIRVAAGVVFTVGAVLALVGVA